MNERGIARGACAAALLLSASFATGAAPAPGSETSARSEPPAVGDAEEIIVTGRRPRYELRLEMQAAERLVYSVFNELNDEPRFEIECAMHAITGTRLRSQVCMPVFERRALTQEGQDYLAARRAYAEPACGEMCAPPDPFTETMPSGPTIARQQRELQGKMREVAAGHPEFVEALVRFVEAKTRYEQTRGSNYVSEATP